MPYINLPAVTPDYATTTLSMAPNNDMPTTSSFVQVLNNTDGGNPKVVTMKTTPDIIIPLVFKGISKANYDILNSFYNSSSKAIGMQKSFKWTHPQTLNTYVAHFISPFSFTEYTYNLYDVSVTIKILGTVATP